MIIHHVAREQVAVSSAVKTLTASTVKTADAEGRQRTIYGDLDVQDADIYVTFDGSTNPSATAGEIWYKGQKYRVWGIENLVNLRFIRVSADGVLEVNYWGGI